MPHFAKRSLQPPRPDSYRRLARMVRDRANILDACAEPQEPQDKRRLTMAIDALYRLAKSMWHRHHGRNPHAVDAEESRRSIELDRLRGL